MDIFAIFFVALISLIAGIIITLCIQYYIFYVYLKKPPLSSGPTPKKSFEYYLPDVSILINRVNVV